MKRTFFQPFEHRKWNIMEWREVPRYHQCLVQRLVEREREIDTEQVVQRIQLSRHNRILKHSRVSFIWCFVWAEISNWIPTIFYYRWQFQLEWGNILKPTLIFESRSNLVQIRQLTMSYKQVKYMECIATFVGVQFQFEEETLSEVSRWFDVESSWHGVRIVSLAAIDVTIYGVLCNVCVCVYALSLFRINWMRMWMSPPKCEIDLHTHTQW